MLSMNPEIKSPTQIATDFTGDNSPQQSHVQSMPTIPSFPIKLKQQKNICQQTSSNFRHAPVLKSLRTTPKPLKEKQYLSRHVINYLEKNYTNTQNHLSQSLHSIPTAQSNHPLELSISTDQIQTTLSTYKSAFTLPDSIISSINNILIPNLSLSHFQELLNYGSPVRDSVIHSFLLVLKSSTTNIYFLDTNFHRDLSTHGWDCAYLKYFRHESSSRYAQSTCFKPTLSSPTIVIPIHINDCHRIALVCRIIGETTFFLFRQPKLFKLRRSHTESLLIREYIIIFFSHPVEVDKCLILHLPPTLE